MVLIPWGAKVSDQFIKNVLWTAEDLQIGDTPAQGAAILMGCMAWESGKTFSPSVKNMAGSGATGLIQFMPSTAIKLGTTVDQLAKMTAEEQINYVWKYFKDYKGRIKTLGDAYMAILWPKGVGQQDNYILWSRDTKPTTYRQNAGLDYNKDGLITRGEAVAKVQAMLDEGYKPGNVREFNPSPTVEEVQVSIPDLNEIIPIQPPPKPPVLDTVKKAASGWAGNYTGVLIIIGSLLLDPNFSAMLGRFTNALATGNGRWGAFTALLGAGLIAYKAREANRDG